MADSKPSVEQANGPISSRIKIVTWNPKRANKSKGHYADLQKLFTKFLFDRNLMSEALVCEQEVTPTAVKNTCKKENLDATYAFRHETTVISPKSGPVYSTREIEIQNERYDLSDLRCSGQVVTQELKGKKIEFILVSFHGEYSSISDDKKQQKIVTFINVLIKLANDYKLLVVVGGDFNIDVIEWKTNIEDKYGGQVIVAPLYAGIPNRRHAHKVIDTFIAVYPDDRKNVPTCKFDIPIPIYMLPAKGYIKGIDNEDRFVNYPNESHPCCKVFNYSHEELQEIKEAILNKQEANFEESYKDNNTHAILPLWPRCKILDELDHDPVMVTIELIPQQVSV